ncbi:unnamed protein product [Musa hybrid cultivar]
MRARRETVFTGLAVGRRRRAWEACASHSRRLPPHGSRRGDRMTSSECTRAQPCIAFSSSNRSPCSHPMLALLAVPLRRAGRRSMKDSRSGWSCPPLDPRFSFLRPSPSAACRSCKHLTCEL